MNKRTFQRWTTPAGIAVWPRLSTPDTKFKAEGEYSLKLKFTGDIATSVRTQIKAFAKAGYEEMCRREGKPKLRVAGLPLGEDEDGNLIVTTKLKAKVQSKDGTSFEQRPALFDAKGNVLIDGKGKTKLADLPSIGGGSVCKACVEVVPWFTPALGAGISLRLRGVQVITLVEYAAESASAKSMGFTEEEQGYVAGGESFDLHEGPVAVESIKEEDDVPF